MKYVRQEIDSWLYSNITQDYNDYDPGETYITEDIASPTNASVVTLGGYYWRSLINGNLGNNPEETENKLWNRWKVANVNAMLDQKALTKTTVTYIESDADYLSTDTATDIPADSLVWDVVNNKMYRAVVATNDLPNADFSDEALWENKSDIIVEFLRGNIDLIGLGYLTTSEVKIEHFDSLGNLLPDFTQTFSFSVNEDVFDLWSYIYSPYSIQVDRALKIDLAPIGYKIRVTITKENTTNTASCGFLVGGEAVDMGQTYDEVGFNFNSFSTSEFDTFGNLNVIRRNVQDLVDFETAIDRNLVPRARRRIKSIYDEVVMFVVDPSTTTAIENGITLGKIENASVVARVMNKNIIAWSVFESI